jgi:A/G-specific adenine glycosylase
VPTFRRVLLAWYARVKRDLPWRRTRDPYAIWISEIMLQQTRVAAALPYYERFLRRFPDAASLASAPEADVLSLWAGLGYYSRARNLHRAAKAIVASGGRFPETYEGLLELPGIGEYTAAAIGSMAFDLPRAAVDGNLLRVLARLDNDTSDIGSPKVRTRFALRAEELICHKRPGEFNQALMELGATVCVPKSPRCGECPVRTFCAGLAAGRAAELPVKLRQLKSVEATITILLIQSRNRILLSQRPLDARQMAEFWELPEASTVPLAEIGREIGEVRHTITRHNYIYRIHLAEWRGRAARPLAWKRVDELSGVLLTTASRKALEYSPVVGHRQAGFR